MPGLAHIELYLPENLGERELFQHVVDLVVCGLLSILLTLQEASKQVCLVQILWHYSDDDLCLVGHGDD